MGAGPPVSLFPKHILSEMSCYLFVSFFSE
jgi:hypothetical protein